MSQRIVKHHLKDLYLLMILLGLIILSSAMLTGLFLGDPFYLQLSPFDSMSDYQYCTSKYQLTVYVPLILSTRFALLLLMTIWAYKIRKIPDLFNETRQLVFTVYNLFFLSITLPTIDLTMGRGKDMATIAYGICTFSICILTALIMFVPKLILVIKMHERRRSSSSTFIFNQNSPTPSIKSDSSTESSIKIQQYSENTCTLRNREPVQNSYHSNRRRSSSLPST
jgi:hypothetical protein